MVKSKHGGYESGGKPLSQLPKVPAGPAPGARELAVITECAGWKARAEQAEAEIQAIWDDVRNLLHDAVVPEDWRERLTEEQIALIRQTKIWCRIYLLVKEADRND